MTKILSISIFFMLVMGCAKNRTDEPIFLPDEEKTFGAILSQYIQTRPGIQVLPKDSFTNAYGFTDSILKLLLDSGKFSNTSHYTWKIKFVRDASVNIFNSCDGTIFINTGLIAILPSLDQFAGILAQQMHKMDQRLLIGKIGEEYGNYSVTSAIQQGYILGMDSLEFFVRRVPATYDENFKADRSSVETLYKTNIDARGLARFYTSVNDLTDNSMKADIMISHPNFNMKNQAIYDRWNELGGKKGSTYQTEYENFRNSVH